jgi:hypothetical protein
VATPLVIVLHLHQTPLHRCDHRLLEFLVTITKVRLVEATRIMVTLALGAAQTVVAEAPKLEVALLREL